MGHRGLQRRDALQKAGPKTGIGFFCYWKGAKANIWFDAFLKGALMGEENKVKNFNNVPP